MLRLAALPILVFLSTFAHADAPLSSGPFQGVDIGALSPSQREAIIQASEDFEQVLKGKRPTHAVLDEKAPLPADGGTHFFLGNGYKLTVMKSLSSFGGAQGSLHGYIYGPVVAFDKSLAPGSMPEVVSLRFYTSEQLQQLLSSR